MSITEERPSAVDARAIPPDTFGTRIMLARHMYGLATIGRGLSIREAAELCGIGRGAWTNWERGARPMDILDHVEVISERLRVDRVWLRDGGPLAKPTPKRARTGATRGYPLGPIETRMPGPAEGPARPETPVTGRPINEGRRPADRRPASGTAPALRRPSIQPRRVAT